MQSCPDLLIQIYTKCKWERAGEVHGVWPLKKPQNTFCPKHFPLHLKVKLCISKINLSHVSHFFPLTANCCERAHCRIKDFQNVIFIPNEKTTFFSKHITTFNLKATYIWLQLISHGSSNNPFSTDQFIFFLKLLVI